jgi:ribonuclease D
VIAQLVGAHEVPAENLLSPDLLRRLAWDPPKPLTEDSVLERLRAGGARAWQIKLTSAPLAAAMAASTTANSPG